MSKIIYRPKEKHICRQPMDERWIKSPLGNRSAEPYNVVPPVGTIWRCDCGRLWEVMPNRYRNVMGNKWELARYSTQLKVWWMLRKSKVGIDD